jgi:hypothetical protein
MQLPTLQQVIDVHSQSTGSQIGRSQHALFQQFGNQNLIPLFVEAFPKISRSEGRSAIIVGLVRYARTHQQVVSLAISALNDRSQYIREEACSILAYSLRDDVLRCLEPLLSHKDSKTKLAAAAAIAAITHKNHHLFVDRSHTGNTFWVVNPSDKSAG